MISFVVIGKNEEKNIPRCLQSIHIAAESGRLSSFEIIYVDSDSKDNSVLVASEFPNVSVYKIVGPSNAALGRNVGAKEAKGSILFFLDADMELDPHFIPSVWDPNTNDLKFDFVSGQVIDVVFGRHEKRQMGVRTPGGTFMIRRSLWESVGGMRTRFRAGEEGDLALRLMKKGCFFTRTQDTIVLHHTVPYLHGSRMWKILTQRSFYNRAVLYRHHLLNPYIYKIIWRLDKTCLLLITTIIATIFSPVAGALLFAAYLAMIVVRASKNAGQNTVLRLIGFYFISDLLNIVYFIGFYPRDLKENYFHVNGRHSQIHPTQAVT
jgi:glycosyltransferase involved in cell wall biosynthesis